MKPLYFFLTVVFFISFIPALSAQSCTCLSILDELIIKVEENYIGYHLEVINEQVGVYRDHIEQYQELAYEINNTEAECAKLLQHFLNFFHDDHLFVYEKLEYGSDSIQKFKERYEQQQLSVPEDTLVKSPFDFRHDPSGRWTNGTEKFKIIKKDEDYLAYKISPKSKVNEFGQFKLRFSKMNNDIEGFIYTDSFVPKYIYGGIYKEGSLLRFTGGKIWARIENDGVRETSLHNLENPQMPVIKAIDDETVLFTIPSFLVDANEFINYLIANKDILFQAQYLIFDVRGNTGGNALYTTFMSLFAGQVPDGNQGMVLASETTLEYFSRLTEKNPDMYQPVVNAIKENMGSIVDGPYYKRRTYDPQPTNIEWVGILADRGSKSASESFILSAKAYSSKVITFGENTGGVIDYTSIHMIPLGCSEQGMFFGYPTSTLNKFIPDQGYNKTGIIPDVPLNESVDDKILFVQQYLRKLQK